MQNKLAKLSRNTYREMPYHTTFGRCTRLAILILFIVTWKPLPTAFAATNSNILPAIQRCQELTAASGNLYRLRSELEIRAQQQDALAEFCLSFMPDPRNAYAAFYWLQQSATHGLPDAQLLMGTAYETGMWTDVDPSQALAWFTRAAEQNFGPAQFELGAIYYEGRLGLKPDHQESLFWITLADHRQIPEAQELRAALERTVVTQEREIVRQRVQTWYRTHADR